MQEPGDREVWVDYLLVIPAQQFTEGLLERLPRDNTAEFITRCGDNHFLLSPNSTGEQIFSKHGNLEIDVKGTDL